MLELVITADAIMGLQRLSDESVDCIVTSPPYYNLRDYGCEGQLGLEKTPEEYINNLVSVFRECKRVLKKQGTLWVNIGDSYAGSGKGAASCPENAKKYKQGTSKGILGAETTINLKIPDCKPKDLIGIPWMLAFALRSDGWYLRQDIIWYKPNTMPESVKDRCTKSHEHIFLLSKSRKYYFDFNSIKEPCVGFDKSSPRGSKGTLTPNAGRRKGNSKTFRGGGAYTNNKSFDNSSNVDRESHGNVLNITGLRSRRDVWSIATRGYKGAHFATFPPDLIEPCIKAGCPEGGVVCDPFCGSGTTGKVAKEYNRGYILIDLNPAYTSMSRDRCLE